MGSGVAAEQDGTPAARLGVFGCWTEGVSPDFAIGSMGLILATRIGEYWAASSGCWIPSSRSFREWGSTCWTGRWMSRPASWRCRMMVGDVERRFLSVKGHLRDSVGAIIPSIVGQPPAGATDIVAQLSLDAEHGSRAA